MKSQLKLAFANRQLSIINDKKIEAEVKMAVLTASANVPLAFHNTLSPMIRTAFSDSKIAIDGWIEG